MKYETTKKECQKQIDKLSNVCDECGRELKPQKTVDNAGNPTYWIGCMHGKDDVRGAWGKFTHGTPKEVYKLAYKVVLDDNLYLGTELHGSDFEYKFREAVSETVKIINNIERLKKTNTKPRFTKAELRKIFTKEQQYNQ